MDNETLTEISRLLIMKELTLSVAESCTSGLLGHWLTNVSGSSKYFMGGLLCYSNDAKQRILGVSEETMIKYGAVSEETARELARQAQILFKTSLALSVTGIAGPTGGTPEKPVGLTYIGFATPSNVSCQTNIWKGSRLENKESSVKAALHLLHQYLVSPE